MLKEMRLICGLDKIHSLKAMEICIQVIEKNFLLDDDVKDKDYEILIYYLDKLYADIKKELLTEVLKNDKH